jgi:hypothetical protein
MLLRLTTSATEEVGSTPHGKLSIFPVIGGYLRTLPRFETAAPKYAFLNRLLAVGIGEIRPDGPVHAIEEIL